MKTNVLVNQKSANGNQQTAISNKKWFVTLIVLLFAVQCSVFTIQCFSQASINTTGAPPDAKAILDVSGSNTGVLINRMTTSQRNLIAAPAEGLLIFDLTTNCFEAYVNGGWYSVSCPTSSANCNPPAAPGVSAATNHGCNSFTANWSTSTGATAYFLDVSADNFSTFAEGYNNLYVGNTTSLTVTGLSPLITYSYRLRAESACGTGANSSVITVNPIAGLSTAPTAGTNTATTTSITWNWNTVSGASGYQWNSINSYPGQGHNVVSSPSFTQNGLSCSNSYNFYVWAYGNCGFFSPVRTLTQATKACPCNWNSDNKFVVNHTAGDGVTPSSAVTITYTQVQTNIIGLGSECWLTQNLGASAQPTSAEDPNINARGWFWQFGKPQGYAYNGGITPSWPGSYTDPNTDWTAANGLTDPCSKLGIGWRLPTYQELSGVYTSTYNKSKFNSDLKLNFTGYISYGTYSSNSETHFWSNSSNGSGADYMFYISKNPPNYDGGANYWAGDGAGGAHIRCVNRLCNLNPPNDKVGEQTTTGTGNFSNIYSEATITINSPSGVQSGDVLISAITADNNNNQIDWYYHPVAGWTQLTSNSNGSGLTTFIYYKIATASEPSNYTWTFNYYPFQHGGTPHASGVITDLRGSFCNFPWDLFSTAITSAYTAPGITTAVNNEMLVAIFGSATGTNTWSAPSGMTAGYSGGQGSTSTGIFYGVQATAGASGTKTGIPSTSDSGNAFLISLH
jgi:hypothetical protein